MNIAYKIAYGFSAIALGMGSVSVMAMKADVEQKQIRIKDKPSAKTAGTPTPTEPTAAEIETGQLLDKGPRPWDKPKSATNPADTTPTPAAVETGQLRDKGPRQWDKPKSATNPTDTTPTAASAAENDLCGLPYTPPCRSDATVKSDGKPVEPTAAEIETGQLLDKGPKWPNKPNAKTSGSGGRTFLFAALGALAAIGGIFVAAGGDDTPTSP